MPPNKAIHALLDGPKSVRTKAEGIKQKHTMCAKLKARGRIEVFRVFMRWENSQPCHSPSITEPFRVEVEWEEATRVLMSDNKVLVKSKWKHFKHEKPFSTGYYVAGTLKEGMTPQQWLEKMLQAGYVQIATK